MITKQKSEFAAHIHIMNNHSLQMNSSNGSYCNITYQHNQSMRIDQQGQTRLVPAPQNLITNEVDVSVVPSTGYQSQPAYNHQQLQQVVRPINDTQGYMYMQPNHMTGAPSLYQMTNDTTYVEQPQTFRSQMRYAPQPGQQHMQLASDQYGPIQSRNVPPMLDQYQQYCVSVMQPRQIISSDRMVNYPTSQLDVPNSNTNFGRELIDQSSPVTYQQPMDLHPTIKQQQQQQQQDLQHHQETLDARNQISTSSSDVSTSIGIGNSYCYNDQLPNSSHGEKPINNLIIAQNRLMTRSKSDLEASDVKSTFEHPNSATHRSQNQRSLSSRTPYISRQQQQMQEHRANLLAQPERRQQVQDFLDMRSSGNIPQDWLDTVCRQLIEHMDRFGICVIDNFLGPLKGELIFREVQQLYNSGHYTKGRLVGNKLASRALGADTGIIRSDRVIWIDGCENGCEEINNLIQTLCSVITNSSRLSLYSNNGLDKIVISKRTKAHVACYPGNGTRYIKHVDNPNGDGRVITSIYYLNKDWNTERDGGLLRMFPAGINEVANIEPLFDRVLFFWSDRRNPHEVLPAYRDRFAITVWYISENHAA